MVVDASRRPFGTLFLKSCSGAEWSDEESEAHGGTGDDVIESTWEEEEQEEEEKRRRRKRNRKSRRKRKRRRKSRRKSRRKRMKRRRRGRSSRKSTRKRRMRMSRQSWEKPYRWNKGKVFDTHKWPRMSSNLTGLCPAVQIFFRREFPKKRFKGSGLSLTLQISLRGGVLQN